MELTDIDKIDNHQDLKTFIETVSYMLINNELSPQKARILALLIKQHSIEIDKAKNEIPFWNI